MGKFGKKAERTLKCSCNNHRWSIFEFTISKMKDKYTVSLWCQNCNALWDTKSMNDDIFVLLNEKQQEAYLTVINNQLAKEKDIINTRMQQINQLKTENEKSNKKLQKYRELIEHYQT